MNTLENTEIIDETELDQCNAVVLYRLPFEDDKHLLLGQSERLINGLSNDVLRNNGFIMEPFDSNKRHGIFINTIIKQTYIDGIPEQALSTVNRLLQQIPDVSLPLEVDQETYRQQFAEMHRTLQDAHMNKVILSKVKVEKDFPVDQLTALFDHLCMRYSHAFVYCLNSPETGVWIGAGPELLLKDDGLQLNTVSLAGTIPNKVDGPGWSEKEIVEQKMVTDYVESTLQKNGISDYQKVGPETMEAGQVKHLRTRFSILKTHMNGGLLDLLYHLHPTPAVCGMPKQKAFDLIQQVEQYDRRFYTGFLGPVNKDAFEFYVNIRCLQVGKDGAALYVGGGLTRESEVEKEWAETELKAETLLAVIKNMRNLQGYE